MLGKLEGRRKRDQQSMRWLNGIIDSVDINLSKPQELVIGNLACCSPWDHKELGMTE